jgi:chromosome segregation ATPase
MEMQRLQALVQTLEAQNKELKQALPQEVPMDDNAKIRLEEQHAAAVQRASELEASLRTVERNGIEKQGKIEVLERLVAEMREDVAKARADGESRAKEVKIKLDESETLVGSLKGLIEAKASAASENDANLAANQAEIEVLRGQVARITNDLEQERKELGSHIDELRRAGQVRILCPL